MSSTTTVYDSIDIESQNVVMLSVSNPPPRDPWRCIFLILKARKILISRATEKAKKGANFPSYGIISTGNEEDAITLEALHPSPQRPVGVSCDGTNYSTDGDGNLQHANIDRIVKAKDLGSLHRFGGVQGIAEALDTNLEKGIPGDEDDLRSRSIINTLSKAQAPKQGFFPLLRKSCNNIIILLLFASAMMSIGFGIKEKGPRTGWCEGAIIMAAVIILVVVPTVRDFWRANSKKPRKEQKPSANKQMVTEVLRGGTLKNVSFCDVVVGDIVCLRRGNKVPGDGLFITGDLLKLDDGLATIDDENPFLYYGAKVVKGHGRMLVTAVGMNTLWSEQMSQVSEAPNKTPLLAQLDRVNTTTQIIGLSISILIPVVVFLRYKLANQKHENGVPEIKGKPIPIEGLVDAIKRIVMQPRENVNFLTTFLTMLVIGIVEGVPCIVILAIFYWNKKALSNTAFAKEPLACLNMGSVTTLCTDRVGGLTLNQKEVDMCWIGEQAISEDSEIDANVVETLCHGIITDALIQDSPSNSTEDAIRSWATLSLGMEMERLRQICTIVDHMEPKSSEEGSSVLLKKEGDEESTIWLHWKGPAKNILSKCSQYYDSSGRLRIMNDEKRFDFKQIIENMHSKRLQIVALAYKQVYGLTFEADSLILIGLLGLKHIDRREIIEAIEAFRNAGVNVILTSEAKASVMTTIGELPCNSGRHVLEGEFFRNRRDDERMEMVDKICIIGNCLPSDKLELVKCLKRKGHNVVMVGSRTNETPALKEANVGIAMGKWSSELAREGSVLTILDGNFSSLVPILRCGRCAYNNIQKYIQHEVTMVIAGLLITAITTIALGNSPITIIQSLWANLIVAVSGGLALLTEQPSERLMKKPPVGQTDAFITKAMWRNIVTQALFQAVILVTFQFKSKSILRINDKVSETMIFNSFVLCQVFNQFNARDPRMRNVFKGIHRNPLFCMAVSVTLLLQVAFIEIAHILAGNPKLNGEQWGACFLIGILSLVIDLVVKITSTLIMHWLPSPQCSLTGSTGMTHSESACNLELPLINLDSSANP